MVTFTKTSLFFHDRTLIPTFSGTFTNYDPNNGISIVESSYLKLLANCAAANTPIALLCIKIPKCPLWMSKFDASFICKAAVGR